MALLIPTRNLRRGAWGLVLWLLWSAGLIRAAEPAPPQYSVKAVLLFNLARFVDWPPQAFANTNSPILIGILGQDPFGPALRQVAEGEQVNGRKVEIWRCGSLEEARGCQIIFISASEQHRARTIVDGLRGWPVLTVSDLDGFCRRDGGMVAFRVNEERKIRVQLNLAAARTEHLSVSSKLIQVAELETSSVSWPESTPAKQWASQDKRVGNENRFH